MRCPFCKSKDTAVVDSRASEDEFSIRRRRQCGQCGKRFTTFERVEISMPVIVKRTVVRREYDRDKLRASMRLALRKRPVGDEQIEEALTLIEQRLRSLGEREVSSEKVGEFVLEELKRLDKVAYVRFASVYYNVEDPEQFKRLMRDLESE